ncbi:two-component system sensor histidine kinase NtrB [Magnetococcales bacterium HHB-1]
MSRFEQLSRLVFIRLFVTAGLFFFSYSASPLTRASEQIFLPQFFIASLFLITLFYILWLRTRRALDLLTEVQCAVDPILISILVILTGGVTSPLHFLYGLAVLNTALLLGRREALVVAGMSVLLSAVAVSLNSFFFNVVVQLDFALFRQIMLFSSAYLITALLGGALSEKAAGLQDSLANLALLNEQIISAIPDGLISVNRLGVIWTANGWAEKILGLSKKTLVGSALKTHCPEFQWVIDGAENAERNPVYVEMRREKRILGVSLTPLKNRQGKQLGNLLTFRDLSKRKKLERKLAEKEKRVLTGNMAAYVAHEIRNPLASISSASQMLQMAKNPEQLERIKRIILEESDRLNHLITDFLTFSRPPKANREQVHLHAFLENLHFQLQKDVRWKKMALNLDIPQNVTIHFDIAHLKQIFWNLFINTSQACKDGAGTVDVVIQKLSSTSVAVFVLDDGPGMPSEVLRKAQEPFYTTRSTGTGLGLSVVEQLLRINGGRVSLKNRNQCGEAFYASKGLRVKLIMESVDGEHSCL